MEMPPGTLKDVGVNDLFVVVVVDESFTTEQAASDSLGTHRVISSNSNTDSISSIDAIHRILRTLCSIHLSSRSRKIAFQAAHTQGSNRPLEILSWDDKVMSVVVGHSQTTK